MKKHFLSLSVGITIGLLIGTSSGAFATVGERVAATFQKYNITVNGANVELSAEPLVYNGSTYLPLRAAANLLGYDVTYKADSQTIELTEAVEIRATTRADEIEARIAKLQSSIANETESLRANEETLEWARLQDEKAGRDEASPSVSGREFISEHIRNKIAEYESELAELVAELAELQAQQ